MTEESKPFGFLPLRSDRALAPGTLSHGINGALHIAAEAERYRIEAGDLRGLLFYGRVSPIIADRPQATPRELTIEGHAAMNASGKAVMLHSRAGSYIIPLVSFQRVARGEAISAPLFPLVPGNDGPTGATDYVQSLRSQQASNWSSSTRGAR